MSDDHHLAEELQDLLDGRVKGPARAEIEVHVAQCSRCRQELAVLERARAVARALAPLAPPANLTARIAGTLDGEDRAPAPGSTRRRIRYRWPFVVGGLTAAAAVVALLVLPSAGQDLSRAVAHDLARYRASRLALDLQTADPAALERFFTERGIGFPTRVFDLAMMRYRLAGGRAHQLAGRASAFFAYTGPDATPIICEMYRGTLAELPAGAEQRVHDGITFLIYRVSGATVVFWQEGAVICALASQGNAEDVVQLAYAKAVRA